MNVDLENVSVYLLSYVLLWKLDVEKKFSRKPKNVAGTPIDHAVTCYFGWKTRLCRVYASTASVNELAHSFHRPVETSQYFSFSISAALWSMENIGFISGRQVPRGDDLEPSQSQSTPSTSKPVSTNNQTQINQFFNSVERTKSNEKNKTHESITMKDCQRFARPHRWISFATHHIVQDIDKKYLAFILEMEVNSFLVVFGFSDYKGKQREIVEGAIEGAFARVDGCPTGVPYHLSIRQGLDVFVVAPTGMGKVLTCERS